MKENRDNIYIYLWEEANTVYVGRTVNPKGRHYQHKHRKAERTYQFSNECGVKHPKMVIIENDLTIEEGVEREKYWIDYYRNNTEYEVLNKSCGGQSPSVSLTEEEREIKRKQYQKEYYESHKSEIKEKYKAYRMNYRGNNKEKIQEAQKRYYEAHKNEILKKRNTNKEYAKEYWKEYKEKNAEKIKEKDKKRYILNREKRLEYGKKYREEHREELLAKKRTYRELQKKNGQ